MLENEQGRTITRGWEGGGGWGVKLGNLERIYFLNDPRWKCISRSFQIISNITFNEFGSNFSSSLCFIIRT